MGGSYSSRKKHLTHEEIEKLSNKNETLQALFNQFKNANGFICLQDLENIFDKKVNVKILKKLFKIVESEKNKFSYLDLKYLYSLFITENYEAKLNFFADLIFIKKSSITLENYRKKLNLLFSDFNTLYRKLIDNYFINNMTNNNKILRDNFIKNLDSQLKTFFTEFSFLKNIEDSSNHSVIDTNKLILNTGNSAVCECMSSKARNKVTESIKLSAPVKYY